MKYLPEPSPVVSYSIAAMEQVTDALRVLEVAQLGAQLMMIEDLAPNIEGLLRTSEMFGEMASDHPNDRAPGYAEDAKFLVQGKFQGFRRNAVVSGFSALENYLKCILVDHLKAGDYGGLKVLEARVSLPIVDAIEFDGDSRLFVVADVLWQETKGRSLFERIISFLKAYCRPEIWGYANKQSKAGVRNVLDEGYAIRNSIVHHGGRATTDLNKRLGLKKGAAVVLGELQTYRYLAVISRVVSSIDAQNPFGETKLLL